ncbi:MAG: hypothetical protein Q9222_004633 [Ikaeria aurantiellina]
MAEKAKRMLTSVRDRTMLLIIEKLTTRRCSGPKWLSSHSSSRPSWYVDSDTLEEPMTWQFRYDKGLPTTAATTTKAISSMPSMPVLIKKGRLLSM